jgi:hypothetical protein
MIARSATTSTSGNGTEEIMPIIHKSCKEKLVSENKNYL